MFKRQLALVAVVAFILGVALITAAAPGSAPTPNTVTSPPPVLPSISGFVASAATGKPIAGALIEVFEQVDPDRARERRLRGEFVPDPVARGVTDAAGIFRFAVPPSMRIVVVAAAPGFMRSLVARPMVLTRDRDLGSIDLPAGRKLAGRVLDPTGKPVAGAAVVALADRGARPRSAGASFLRSMVGFGTLTFPVTGRTGADGSFALDGLPQRTVALRVLAPGFAPALKSDLRGSSSVTVTLGPGTPLEGRVVAPDGKTPVEGAWVLAGEDGWDGITRSGTGGKFRIENVRPGPAEIVAMIPSTVDSPAPAPAQGETGPGVKGSAPAPAQGAASPGAKGPAPGPAALMYAPSASLTVGIPLAPKAATPVLRLRPGGIVRARVIDAETRDPIAGAILSLDAPGEAQRRPAITGAAGESIFTGVPVGHVDLRAEAEGYLEEDLPAFPLTAGQARDMSAALRAAASIEGTVRDSTGRPVVGAIVSVAGPPPLPLPLPVPIFFPVGVDPVTSNAQGRFLLDRLPPKVELKISVSSQAYAPWDTAGIKLRPGERRAGMEILLDAGLTISGRVVDGDGKPVTAAAITASRRPDEGPGGMVIRLGGPGGGPGGGRGPGGGGRSGMRGGLMPGEDLPEVFPDEEGRFVVRGARPGVWSIDVESPGFAPKSVAGLKLEESSRSLDAGDIVLEPGVFLKGIVQTPAGEPVPFARGRAMKDFSLLSEFMTLEDGTFASGALAPGSIVSLVIDADGFAAVEKPGLTPPAEDLVVTLLPSSNVRGRVVEKETGRPVPDFGIAVSRSRAAGGGGARANMQIMGEEVPFHSEDGAFLIEDIDPGKITMAARAPGYRDAILQDLEVPEGKDLQGVTFTLERSATVSGVVTDDGGRPLPGATVEKKEMSGGGPGMMMRAAGGRGRTTTDGDGRFILDGLDRGPMTLTLAHADFEPADLDVDTTRDVENLRVSLSRGATIFGIVMHEEDGSPIARANVTATAAGGDRIFGARSATSGPDGAFSIEGVPAGRYAVRAEAAGMRPAAIENVMIEAGPLAAPIELKLGGGVTLTGTIAGVKEADLPKFSVRVVGGRGGGFGKNAPVDAAGRFEVKGMSPGTATLMAGSGFLGGRTMTKTVEIPEGVATFETTIEFPRGNVVEGTVTRGGGPVAGASVIFMHATARTSTTATTDAEGRYTAEDLDDGEYNVTVMQFSSGISHSTKARVEADRRLDIELPLAKISGHVTDALSHDPIEQAMISIRKTDSAPATGGGRGPIIQKGAQTDATGFYQIEGLEDGAYDLTVRRDGYAFQTRRVLIVLSLDSAEASFDLQPAAGFAFRAVDAASGLPLKALQAAVLTGGGDPLLPSAPRPTVAFQGRISADASGAFRLETLKPGTYRVVLGGEGVATETLHDVEVPAPERTITMVQGGSIEIRATSLKEGETARAALFTPDGRVYHPFLFPPEPVFNLRPDAPLTIEDIKPGDYILRAAMPGGSADKLVTVSAGTTTQVAIP